MDFFRDVENCVQALQNGNLILYPTDTIWGIGCDATNTTAVAKIYTLKKRDEQKAMIVLIADEKDLLKYIKKPDIRIFDYLKTLQKPTTVIYEEAIGLAENLIAKDKTVAIRVIHDEFCKQVIKKLGKPIVSTSANLAGYPSPQKFSDIHMDIINGVDYVVQHRKEEQKLNIPSTIVKWNPDGSVKTIRS